MSFDTLTLSGGGSKGMIQLGVLHHAWELGLLKDVTIYSGTSIGSVICLLLSIGYTPLDIFQESLNDTTLSNQIINIKRLFSERGLITLDPFMAKISTLVRKKLGFIPTLAEFQNKTGKSIYISVTNTETDEAEYICSSTHGDLNIIDAVTMSCSIPIIFPPKLYKGVYYVDGALTDNLPITPVICRIDKLTEHNLDSSIEENAIKNIGVRKSNILAIEILRKDSITTNKTTDILSYIYKLLNIPINKMQRLQTFDALSKASVKKITIYWDPNRETDISDINGKQAADTTKANDILELNLTEDKKMEMFTFGYREVKF